MYGFENLQVTNWSEWRTEHVVIALLIALLYALIFWRIFEKAKKPGWYAIIPILNVLTLLKIVGRPWWWIILLLIPIVDIVTYLVLTYDLAKAFGKGIILTLVLWIAPVFGYLYLALSSAKYKGPRKVSYSKV